MFVLAENEKIGAYLNYLICKKFKSARKFCIQYLGINPNEKKEKEDLIQNMCNRLSQIKTGKKPIQISDLPKFCKLLDVTCEEILSAGNYFVPNNDRPTNYKFAFSKEEGIWEDYINSEEELILNTDEYNKTVIDYALQFKNYKLLKYLVNKGYIWFNEVNEKNCFETFHAGTSIKRKHYQIPDMASLIAEDDILRRKMITLAIENDDFEMLKTLKAREIPSLYQACFFTNQPIQSEQYYDAEMLENIAHSINKEILCYFSEEFEIIGNFQKRINTFIFPFVGKLIELLVKNKNPYTEIVLKNCIEHNKITLKKLNDLIPAAMDDYLKQLNKPQDMFSEKQIKKWKNDAQIFVMGNYIFDTNENTVKFANTVNYDEIYTNVIFVNVNSGTTNISNLVDTVNEYYEKIQNYKGGTQNVKV